jgi:hypothetical protein
MPAPIHIFVVYNANQTIPKLVETIKTSSNKWINDHQFTTQKFDWQKRVWRIYTFQTINNFHIKLNLHEQNKHTFILFYCDKYRICAKETRKNQIAITLLYAWRTLVVY